MAIAFSSANVQLKVRTVQALKSRLAAPFRPSFAALFGDDPVTVSLCLRSTTTIDKTTLTAALKSPCTLDSRRLPINARHFNPREEGSILYLNGYRLDGIGLYSSTDAAWLWEGPPRNCRDPETWLQVRYEPCQTSHT